MRKKQYLIEQGKKHVALNECRTPQPTFDKNPPFLQEGNNSPVSSLYTTSAALNGRQASPSQSVSSMHGRKRRILETHLKNSRSTSFTIGMDKYLEKKNGIRKI